MVYLGASATVGAIDFAAAGAFVDSSVSEVGAVRLKIEAGLRKMALTWSVGTST